MQSYTTLIEPEALAALLRQAPGQVLVCDCSFNLADHEAGANAYAAGHIPGAAYLHLETVLSGPKSGSNGRHPLPAPGALAAEMAALGTTAATQIVAYDAGDSMFAARLWWLMRWLGHAKVAVLNGGLAAWRQAGLPLESAPPPARPQGDFVAASPLVKTFDYAALRAGLGMPGRMIVDARAPDRFRGENETLDAQGGHIPGARNRFFKDNLEADGRFKPTERLRAEFSAVLDGMAPEAVVNQCGSGVTACHNLLAMEIAGLSGAALYPGSWSEWSAQPDAQIATGAA